VLSSEHLTRSINSSIICKKSFLKRFARLERMSTSMSTSALSSSDDDGDVVPLIKGKNTSKKTTYSGEIASRNEEEEIDLIEHRLETELVERICAGTFRVVITACVAATGLQLCGALGRGNSLPAAMAAALNPAAVVIGGVQVRNCSPAVRGATVLTVLALAALRHALFLQGCSACAVPMIYGAYPAAVGFLFRTRKAIMWAVLGVLALVAGIYVLDLTGRCPSNPIDPSDRTAILADRLIPMLALIVSNALILNEILRQSQESLRRQADATRSARQLAHLRRDVLHRVTHELRTPLSGLVGSVELLAMSETMTDKNDRENVATVRRCLESILGICDDVLAVAEVASAGEEGEKKPFVLASCVDDVAEIFASSLASSGIELRVEFDGDTTAVVWGLEVKLRQVLANLVGNARKFTESGSITIRIQTKDDEKDNTGLLRCTFEVEDTGIGIDTNDADMLFQPFHQGEQGAVSRRHKGSGLGLSICKQYIEQMGGTIEVGGALGKGSRFRFELLLRKEPVGNVTSEEDATTAQSCEIVIADSIGSSLKSCQSLVRSVVPSSANITTVDSCASLLGLIDEHGLQQAGNDTTVQRHIALIRYNPNDKDFASAISRIRGYGWVVILYCNRGDFATALEKASSDVYAVFRRPLQLLRLGLCLREALAGVPPKSAAGIHGEDQTTSTINTNHQEVVGGALALDTGSSLIDSAVARKAEKISCAGTATNEKLFELDPNAKVVVVDDTQLNVKVMVKMLARSTSAQIVPLSDGESAIELAEAAQPEDVLLYLMDWYVKMDASAGVFHKAFIVWNCCLSLRKRCSPFGLLCTGICQAFAVSLPRNPFKNWCGKRSATDVAVPELSTFVC